MLMDAYPSTSPFSWALCFCFCRQGCLHGNDTLCFGVLAGSNRLDAETIHDSTQCIHIPGFTPPLLAFPLPPPPRDGPGALRMCSPWNSWAAKQCAWVSPSITLLSPCPLLNHDSVLLVHNAAFDTVDHNILLEILERWVRLIDTVLNLFKSYLHERDYFVSFVSQEFERTKITCGVPQGSILRPLLFNIYMLLPAQIMEHHNISYHTYADDTQLYILASSHD